MDKTSGANSIYTTSDVTIALPLSLYTEMVCKVNDLEKIKAIVGTCKDGSYIDSETAVAIKALCGLPVGKETK